MTMKRHLVTFLSLCCWWSTRPPVEAVSNHNMDTHYTAYTAYPPYCSTPEQMKERAIPPLAPGGSFGESKLRHVTAIIRHGARTPWTANLPCWKDFRNNSLPWDCKVQTSVSPELGAAWFKKQYDALQFPQFNLSNELEGTCQLGQLIDQGVSQELINGEQIRLAYYDDGTDHHDSRMQLNTDKTQKPWESLYYRADDEQRTLMSGRILLKGLFGNLLDSQTTIPLHTADYERDIIGDNEGLCPRMTQIRKLFYESEEFRIFNESDEANALRDFQQNVLQTVNGDMEIDCLMTTICTDRALPDAINDYSGESNDKSTFLRLYNFYVRQYTIFAMANGAEYSKLSTGPLWAEIMDNVELVLNEKGEYPRLALFSGHDTTILPLLASLSNIYDGSWPPYASKLLIEIHEIDLDGRKDPKLYTTGFAFRLIYNGLVLTDKVEGCPPKAEMCDVATLQANLDFARRDRDCSVRVVGNDDSAESGVVQVYHLFLSPAGFGVFVVIVLSSMAIGCALMYLYLSKTQPQLIHRRSYEATARQENPEIIMA